LLKTIPMGSVHQLSINRLPQPFGQAPPAMT
jgi:hypothetical protein